MTGEASDDASTRPILRWIGLLVVSVLVVLLVWALAAWPLGHIDGDGSPGCCPIVYAVELPIAWIATGIAAIAVACSVAMMVRAARR